MFGLQRRGRAGRRPAFRWFERREQACVGWIRIAAASLLVSSTASAWESRTIVVPRDYSTIQAAVSAARKGDAIKILPGVYVEEIVVSKDLSLKGAGAGATRIQSPAALTPFAVFTPTGVPMGAVIRITGGAKVRISDLTLTGPVPCDVASGGIAAVEGATLEIERAHITRIRPEPADPSTCSPGTTAGVAVRIGLTSSFTIEGRIGSTARGMVSEVLMDKYLNVGVVVGGPADGATSVAKVWRNVMVGETPAFPTLGQAGVAVRENSVGEVRENIIAENFCTDFTLCGQDPINQFQSQGIAIVDARASGSTISHNFVTSSDVGVLQVLSPQCCEIQENWLFDNRFFGVVIQDGDGTASKNTIAGGEVGVGVVADAIDTVGALECNTIQRVSLLPVQELACCGFTATAFVKDDHCKKRRGW